MKIQLPKDAESAIEAAVHSGRFASIDDALAAAWRDFEQRDADASRSAGLGSIGALRDAADELDEIVADAMKRRREEPWRDVPVEKGAPRHGHLLRSPQSR